MDKWYRMDALRNITGPYDMDRIREFARRGMNFQVGSREVKDWLSPESVQARWGREDMEREVRRAPQSDAMEQGINELIGICKGIISDGYVDAKEVDFLKSWLDHHGAVAKSWPANVLRERIDRILSDGVADEIERADLTLLISRLTGVRPGVADAEQLATRLPVDDPPPDVEFSGRSFHLTGNFILGSRAVCVARIESMGGTCQADSSREVDYLVIGALGSEDWAYSPFGREIEAVMKDRGEDGSDTFIISEEYLTFFLTPTPAIP